MEVHPVIKEFVENRLYDVQEAVGLSFILCCQSYYGTIQACLSENYPKDLDLDDREIEKILGEYFSIESCYDGDIYFDLFPEDWDKLQKKLKIHRILED